MQHTKIILFTNLQFSSITQRFCMMETNCSSCWWIVLGFASHQRFCVVKNKSVYKVYKPSRAYDRGIKEVHRTQAC